MGLLATLASIVISDIWQPLQLVEKITESYGADPFATFKVDLPRNAVPAGRLKNLDLSATGVITQTAPSGKTTVLPALRVNISCSAARASVLPSQIEGASCAAAMALTKIPSNRAHT